MQHFVYIQLARGVMQVSKNNYVYLPVFLYIQTDGMHQQVFGIFQTMPQVILQSNLIANVDAHDHDWMTDWIPTHGSLVKCNFNTKHGPFLFDLLPYDVRLETCASNFVMKLLRCKFLDLIFFNLLISRSSLYIKKTVVIDSNGKTKKSRGAC